MPATPEPRVLPSPLAGWAVHAFTASGAVIGMLSLVAAVRGDVRACVLWWCAATAVDAVDGWFARAARVTDTVPSVDGGRLDDIVDYVTYVFVPAFVVWRAGLVPERATWAVIAAMLLSSAYGFSRIDAKTHDHFFTGFPSYWNIVVFYLLAGGLPGAWNGAVLLWLAVMVFVPVGYVYPSRTAVLRRWTVALGAVWAATILLMAWRWPDVNRTWLAASLLYPAYYLGLSLVLHARRRLLIR